MVTCDGGIAPLSLPCTHTHHTTCAWPQVLAAIAVCQELQVQGHTATLLLPPQWLPLAAACGVRGEALDLGTSPEALANSSCGETNPQVVLQPFFARATPTYYDRVVRLARSSDVLVAPAFPPVVQARRPGGGGSVAVVVVGWREVGGGVGEVS
jgi:hypothetical protein